MAEIQKAVWKSSFDLGLGHFSRAHEQLKQCDVLDSRLRAGEYKVSKLYISALRRLWFIVRMVTINKDTKTEMDNNLKTLQEEVNKEFDRIEKNKDASGFKIPIIDKLEQYDVKLGTLLQSVGMGIPIERELNKTERMKGAFGKG